MNQALVVLSTFALAVVLVGAPVVAIMWLYSLFRRRR